MRAIVKDEVRKFAATTSVRGIPRALQAKDPVIRTIWSVAVLLCLSILLWQLTLVVTRYFKYESTTLFKEGSDTPVFPDVTICNVYPLNVVGKQMWTTYTDDLQAIRNNRTCGELGDKLNLNLTDDDCNFIWDELAMPTGLFGSLPITDDGSVADSHLIVDCNMFDWDWGYANVDCNAGIKIAWDRDYYKCYTIQVPDESKRDILGFTVVIYLNDFAPTTLRTSSAVLGQSMATGIRVDVHNSGTVADMAHGISIGPGAETTLTLSAIERTRLKYPYPSQCTDQNYVGDEDTSVIYSANACNDVCVQQQIIANCSCVSGDFTYTETQLASVGFKICGNLTGSCGLGCPDPLAGFSDLYCSYNLDIDFDSCNAGCPWPCNEYRYDTRVSTSGLWPGLSYQMAFYDDYIGNHAYAADKFSSYAEIKEMVANGSITSDESIDRLRQLNLIERNFLQLNVLFDRMQPYVMSDKPSMTLDNLWAQLGGVLSLWLGITIMTTVEFVEFLYTFVRQWHQGRKDAATVSVDEEASKGGSPAPLSLAVDGKA